MALATRESGLHEWPHDSIGGVIERKLALPPVETTRPREPVTETAGGSPARPRRTARRAALAGDPRRGDARAGGPIGDRSSDRRVHRLRPVRPTRSMSATWCRSSGSCASSASAGRPVAVMGGGTGMIGDPSGRSAERNLLDRRDARRPTWRRSAASSSGSSTSRPEPGRGHGQQPRLARQAGR